MPMRKPIVSLLAAMALMLVSLGAHAVPITQLGFVLDASNSVTTDEYDAMRDGLSDAIAALPTDGSVEITLISFSNTPTVVFSNFAVTERFAPVIQRLIDNHQRIAGSGRNLGSAVNQILSAMDDPTDPATTRTVINVATSGLPTNAADALLLDAALANAAGPGNVDAVSFEAIGAAASDAGTLAALQGLAFPAPATVLDPNSTDIPDPIGGSWVVPITDIDNFGDVVGAKVQAIVNGPSGEVSEPAVLALFGAGLFGLIAARRRERRG